MQSEERKELLEILEEHGGLAPEIIAVMLGVEVEKVKKEIASLEASKIILKYTTLINWEKVKDDMVSALIEVKATPQKEVGFDEVAERIYHFPEVKAVSLVSGGFDLLVLVEGKTVKEVAFFVAEKLATLEQVQSTMTHFVLKKYKELGVILNGREDDHRQVVTP